MKRNFRLQKILEYRERIVELEKNKLAELGIKLTNVTSRIIETTNNINKQVDDKQFAENMYKTMYDKYIKKLSSEKDQLIKLRKQLELNIEIQKKKVVEAMDRQKVMQKLKDKHVENYRIYLNKEEIKMIDELAITRGARNED